MADSDPISLWIEGLRQADDQAACSVWNHFAGRLCELARRQLNPSVRRVYDEEDAVQSVFRSVCLGFTQGRFPDLNDRESLWRLMLVITGQKVSNRHRFELQQKRDIRRTLTDSVFADRPDTTGDDSVSSGHPWLSKEPSPEFAAEFLETCDALQTRLDDPELSQVVSLRLEGYTDLEIAEKMNCSRRSIQRRMEIIRRRLSSLELTHEENTDT